MYTAPMVPSTPSTPVIQTRNQLEIQSKLHLRGRLYINHRSGGSRKVVGVTATAQQTWQAGKKPISVHALQVMALAEILCLAANCGIHSMVGHSIPTNHAARYCQSVQPIIVRSITGYSVQYSQLYCANMQHCQLLYALAPIRPMRAPKNGICQRTAAAAAAAAAVPTWCYIDKLEGFARRYKPDICTK